VAYRPYIETIYYTYLIKKAFTHTPMHSMS